MPIARTDTAHVLWNQSDGDYSLGLLDLLSQRTGRDLQRKSIIVLSSIIDNALVSNVLLQQVAEYIDSFHKVKQVLAWSDCGPAHRCLEDGNWVEAATPGHAGVFEKCGKGGVDGLLGQVERWLKNYSSRSLEVK